MTDDYDDARVDRVTRGMLARYSTAKVAREMAHWNWMDYAPHGVTPDQTNTPTGGVSTPAFSPCRLTAPGYDPRRPRAGHPSTDAPARPTPHQPETPEPARPRVRVGRAAW